MKDFSSTTIPLFPTPWKCVMVYSTSKADLFNWLEENYLVNTNQLNDIRGSQVSIYENKSHENHIVCYIDKLDYPTIFHELNHVTWFLIDRLGEAWSFDNQELQSNYLQLLMTNVMDWIDNYIKKDTEVTNDVSDFVHRY